MLPHSANEGSLGRIQQEISALGSPAFDAEIAAGESQTASKEKETPTIDSCAMELLACVERNNQALAEQERMFQYSPSSSREQGIASLAEPITPLDASLQDK